MKKSSAFIFLLAIAFSASAQFRKLRADEIEYLNRVHLQVWNAMPHEYKTWKAVGDEKAFDANKFWCGGEAEEKCFGTCPVSLGTKDSYSVNVFQDFTMPGDQSAPLMGAAMAKITDFQNTTQIAAALKATAKSKLQVKVYCNVMGGEFVLKYCDKVPPVKFTVPVPTTLAIKGLRSELCPMYQPGTKTVDMSGDYYDNAFVVIGMPATAKKFSDYEDGVTRTSYAVEFDNKKISKPVTQSIVVEFTGDSNDIDEAIKLVDWKALYAMIGK